MNITDVIEITGSTPGPTLAIFAGVHGNELAGVLALRQLLPNLQITRGKLLVVFANPPAIAANVRMVNKNLNRCFFDNNTGTLPEDARARELMGVLDQADALLDLHMFYDDDGLPFVICEDDALDLAYKLDVDIISTNWTAVEPGASDGYMHEHGKIGLCVECGPISKAAEYQAFARRTIYQFLAYFDMATEPIDYSAKTKRLIRAERLVYKQSKDFQLLAGFRNFDAMRAGQVIATDGAKKHLAKAREAIIFPHYNAKVGEEAYILGKEST